MRADELIDRLLEFYPGVGPFELPAPGADTVGFVGPTKGRGRADTKNLNKRQKWMDASASVGETKEDKRGSGSIALGGSAVSERRKRNKLGKRRENFGLAGLPGGVRDDPESPVIQRGRVESMTEMQKVFKREPGEDDAKFMWRVVSYAKRRKFVIDIPSEGRYCGPCAEDPRMFAKDDEVEVGGGYCKNCDYHA